MALSLGEIVATLSLRDKLTPALNVASHNLEQAGKSLKQVGERAETAGRALLPLTAFITGAGIAAFKFGKDFEATMTRVGTITDIGVENIDDMREAILDLSPAVGVAPTQLAEALLVVASTGLTGAAALDALEQSAKATAVGLGDTKDIARAVTAAMTAYGAENLSAAEAMDQLFVAVRAGGAEASEFAGSLGRVIGIASQVGVSFAEVTGSMAAFTRLGVNAEEAVTALRGVMSTVLKPSQEARDQLDALGTSVEELRRKIRERGLADALIELVELTKGNDDALAEIIPKVRALAGVMGTAGAQADAYRSIVAQVLGAQGDLDRAFQETSKTVEFKWNQALADGKAAAIALFATFRNEIGSFVSGLAGMTGSLKKFAEGMQDWSPASRTAFVAVTGLVAGIGPVLIGLGLTMKGVAAAFDLAAVGAKGFATALGFVKTGLTFLVGPLGAVLVVLASVTAAVTAGWQAWKLYRENAARAASDAKQLGIDQENLRRINQATGQSFADLADASAFVRKQNQQLHAQLSGFTDSITVTASVLGDVAEVTDDMADALKELRRAAIPLTAVQRQQVEQWQEMGVSAETMGKALDVSTTAVTRFIDTGKRMQELTDQARDAESAMTLLGDTGTQHAGMIHDAWGAATLTMHGFGEQTKVSLDTATQALEAFFKMGQQVVPSMNDFKQTIGTAIGGAARDLPKLLIKAFTGGGGVKGAVNALGVTIGENLFGENGALASFAKSATGTLSKVFGQTIGGALGAAIPGLGALIGPAIAGIGKLFGKLFGIGGPNKKQLAARDEQAKFIESLRAGGGTGSDFQVLLQGASAAITAVGGSAADAERAVRGLLATDKPEQFRAALEQVRGAMELQKTAQDALNEALSRYKFTTEELGPALTNQKLHEQAQQLFKDWQVLTQAGIDITAIGREMQGAINAFLQSGVRAGVEVDVAMRPMIEQMLRMGLLTDDAGNVITDLEAAGVKFSLTMSEGFTQLIDQVKELTDVIRRGLGLAIESIHIPPVHIPVRFDVPDLPAVPMAHGGAGRVTRPTLFLAGEAGPEDVAFSGAGRTFGDGDGQAGMQLALERLMEELRALPLAIQRGVRDGIAQAGA